MLIGYFVYVACLSPFFHDRPHLKYQPIFVLVAVAALLLALARAEQTRFAHTIAIIRDWLPIALTFLAFREMEFFLPGRFAHYYEAIWIRQDRLFLDTWHVRHAIEAFGTLIPYYLELCYFLVYGVAAYCIAVLYIHKRRSSVDLFLTVYLVGTLAAYALFPYFPSQPPRLLFPGMDDPGALTWLRQWNLLLLNRLTIHIGVFPSAHVSSVFSAAWAMFLLFPHRKAYGWGLLLYAVSVAIATIYGRYHYSADVLAGFAVSFLAASLCVVLRNRSSALFVSDQRVEQ